MIPRAVVARHRSRRTPRVGDTLRILVAGALLLSGVALGSAPPPAIAEPESSVGSSEVTVAGRGVHSELRVSVSQSRNLINQVVEVSWRGAKPTEPNAGRFDRNFLSIMQCWGDDPAGPEREQCQYGGLAGDSRGGSAVASRQANYGRTLVDPLETYVQPAGSFANVFVPFRGVNGKVDAAPPYEAFDTFSTNELPFGRTRADGTGKEFFEIQTALEASGLGCGTARVDAEGQRVGRSCWLVVVPRSAMEVDGRTLVNSDALSSSPLSATNWAHRLIVPLAFEPLGLSCPIGSSERRTAGTEVMAEAITRWQPALCASGGPTYAYSAVADVVARRQLLSDTPGLAFLTRPIPVADLPEDRAVVYAPVALSGLAIAFNVESQSLGNAPPEIRAREGSRINELKLTPRLVAKLITQSYRLGGSFFAPHLEQNPIDLTADPEFEALNPAFDGLTIANKLPDMLLPLGLSDAAFEVWRWLVADPEAKAFLEGQPDPHGMTINKHFLGMDLPRDDFPKSDPFCDTKDPGDGRGPLCTLDAHPYAGNFNDAGRSASRGDTLVRANWDGTASPPIYKKSPPQLGGTRAVLAFTDAATAHRYNLPTAALRNPAGEFVRPTDAALVAAAKVMKSTGVPGVVAPDFSTRDAAAYPLTSLTYGATAPSVLDAAARADYANLLRYAATGGQQPGLLPGTLPAGYAPLPQALRQQTLAAARAVLNPPAIAKAASAALMPAAARPTSPPVPDVVSAAPAEPAQPVSRPASEVLPDVVTPVAPAAPIAAAKGPAPVSAPPADARTFLTAATKPVAVGGGRYAVVLALLAGGLAAGTGPVLRRAATRTGG